MNTKLIIGLFILLCAASSVFSQAHAQKKDKITPATHLWLQNYENLLFVPVRSLQQCQMLVKQAALINSSQGHCYLNDNLIRKIECKKPLKRNAEPSCS